ncbi:hypothetical protein AQUCO_02800280v1 [Aquilegia coerulea]|uniref:Cytochrome P450 n=1 Tax=Aquilegia coerulea TaxID=218851 RepID=A0A2G5D4K9_AQUCA|nr:hypothetical protein AQUCO_02800280v1 [Aquilegia coerulea]
MAPILLQWLDFAKNQHTLFHHSLPFNLLFAFSISFIIFRLVHGSLFKGLNLPPSPPKLPIIGNLHQLGKLHNLHQTFHHLSQKYGPLMFLHMGKVSTLVVSSIEMVGEIKINHDIPFASRPSSTASNLLFHGRISVGFAPYGEDWRQLRKIYVMELLSKKKVESFKYVREEEAALMIEKISFACSMGTPIDMKELVTSLTSDIVCRCTLGRKHGGEGGNCNFGEIENKVGKLLQAFCFGDLCPGLGWMDSLTGFIGSLKKVSKELDNFFDQIIDEHLIPNKNNNPTYINQSQTRADLHKFFCRIFIGGTDTTSTTIEWAMTELVKNPNVMKKAQAEVRKVVGKKNKVSDEDIHQMEYLKLVVKETLRLYPAVALNKEEEDEWGRRKKKMNGEEEDEFNHQKNNLKQNLNKLQESDFNWTAKELTCSLEEKPYLYLGLEYTENGPKLTKSILDVRTSKQRYHVPAMTTVFINNWSIHRNPKLWDRAEEFIPERFSENPIDFLGKDFKYIPFGTGRRSCPELVFAVVAVEFAIANLLYWFDWEIPPGEEIDMTETLGLTVSKEIPLRVVPTSHYFS